MVNELGEGGNFFFKLERKVLWLSAENIFCGFFGCSLYNAELDTAIIDFVHNIGLSAE